MVAPGWEGLLAGFHEQLSCSKALMLLEGAGLLVPHCLLCIISFALLMVRMGSSPTTVPGEHLAVLTGWVFASLKKEKSCGWALDLAGILGPRRKEMGICPCRGVKFSQQASILWCWSYLFFLWMYFPCTTCLLPKNRLGVSLWPVYSAPPGWANAAILFPLISY